MSLHQTLRASGEKLEALKKLVPVDKHITRIKELDMMLELGDIWENPRRAGELAKERQRLHGIVEKLQLWGKAVEDDMEYCVEFEDEAERELRGNAEQRLKDVEQFELECMFAGEHDRCDALLTIVSGAGGSEAKEWCSMLLRMYCRYCDSVGYDVELLDEKTSDDGPTCLDAATIRISGGDGLSHGWLRGETGIMRLIRASPFSSSGQRHTSFAAVSVLPDIDDTIDIKIEDKDIEITAQTRGGPGGQNQNRVASCVRLVHVPSDIRIIVSSERDFHKNRATAMKMLKAKLYDIEVRKQNAVKEELFDSQNTAAFANQRRTFTLTPFQLVKDHRFEWETNQAQTVLDGDLKGLLEASLRHGKNQ